MKLKKFKVILKSGISHPTLFDTVGQAIKEVGVKNVAKLEEVEDPKAKKSSTQFSGDEMLVISKRSNEDLDKSLKCGYTVTYNKPNLDKVYRGMTILETSEDRVLIGKFKDLTNWDPAVHKDYIPPGYRPDKDWEWAIFNTDAQIVDRSKLEEEIGRIPGVQGGIGYHTPTKKKVNV
jgi:hypothetical protein